MIKTATTSISNANSPLTVPLDIYNELKAKYKDLQKVADEYNGRLRIFMRGM
jgi:hypothetical protein